MTHTILRVFAFLFLTLGVAAQNGPDRSELMERWRGKSESERAVLRARFEKLQGLAPDERDRLYQRARRMRDAQRDLRQSASPEERAAAGALPPARRDGFWRDRATERSREFGRRMREKLPPELIERLESAPRETRREMLRDFHQDERDRRSLRALRDLGGRVGLSPDHVAKLQDAPLEERLAAVIKLKRQQIATWIEKNGLPPGVNQERWQASQSLSDDEFVERFQRIMRDRSGARRPGGGNWRGPRPSRRPGQQGFPEYRRPGDGSSDRTGTDAMDRRRGRPGRP